MFSDYDDGFDDSRPIGWDLLSDDEKEQLEDAWRNGDLDDHPSLSAADRNPSLCR